MKQLTQQQINQLMMMHQKGLYKKAIVEANNLIKHFPNELMLFNILGVCLEQEGEFEKAANAYKQAIKINPSIPELQFNLGAMLFALNESEKAIPFYKESIRLNPNFAEAYFNLGILFQSQSKFNDAILNYNKALNIQPGFYEAITNIGSIKQLQGDLDMAIELFKKSLHLKEDARGHYNLAGAYRNQGNLISAIDHYRRAVQLGTNEPEFYSDLGDALWHDGQIKEAKEFLNKQHEAEVKIAKMKQKASIMIQKETRSTKKAVHALNKKLHESLTQGAFIKAFYKELTKDALDGFVLSESEESEAEEESEDEEIIVQSNSPTHSELMKAKQYQMDQDVSDISDGEISSENEDEETSPLYSSVQQIDPMKLWRPKFGLTPQVKKKYEQNREELKLVLPKVSFIDKRQAIEKKGRLKAELAMPKRTAYKTSKMGKAFKPRRMKRY